MPKLKKLTAVLSFFLLIVVGWAFVPQEAAAQGLFGRGRVVQQIRNQSATPKIHMLFVWGTKATDTEAAVKISQAKIEPLFCPYDDERAMVSMSASDYRKYIGTYISLEGDNASPQNIIKECRKLAQNAKPNDAVFVYMLCHGASIIEDGDTTETRIHALSPICKDAKNMDLRTIGIRRCTILEAMKSTQHRLDMLVTDSCSVFRNDPPLGKVKIEPIGTVDTEGLPALIALLLTEKGTININSTHPNRGGMDRGELAMAWVPNRLSGEGGQVYLKRVVMGNVPPGTSDINYHKAYDEAHRHRDFAGTVFTNAFLEIALYDLVELDAERRIVIRDWDTDDKLWRDKDPHGLPVPPIIRREPVSSKKFLSDLSEALNRWYKKTEDLVDATKSSGLEGFMQQKTQTLTQFDDFGRALP